MQDKDTQERGTQDKNIQGTTEENAGLLLLKKGQKGIMHALFSRLGLFVLLLILQVFALFSVFHWFENILPHLLGGTMLFTILMVLKLLNSGLDSTAKNTWLVVIMAFPVFGILLYLYTQSEIGHRAVKARVEHLIKQTKEAIPQCEETMERLKERDPGAAALVKYVNRSSCHPVFENTQVTYFPLGEAKWEEMLRQLEQAKEFIFMEYFIVDEGLMWGKVLDILSRKAQEGVDVRVMYDGTCEFSNLPHDYPKRLKKLGIKCKMFSPLVPLLSTHYNYRDHRKILVIDGNTAFNGGVNLADEYINHIEKFGHWKDTAVMLKGEAARSFTLMFLQMWNIDEKEAKFDGFLDRAVAAADKIRGFVLPFGDCPLDEDKVGERVYMDILNRAADYVHIMTPYLILDGEMEAALKFAAERGVDVKLILPGIPDKKIPYALAKMHYASLLHSGVKIYEYTPGFVHAKVFVSDDKEAVVGTINLDYRSLYHHFECATWMYETPCIDRIEQDFEETRQKCREVTPETIWQGYKRLRWVGYLMKVVAPLL
ncbi:MAG: cardiolipin synthase [Lachnospiraceae bacterium]